MRRLLVLAQEGDVDAFLALLPQASRKGDLDLILSLSRSLLERGEQGLEDDLVRSVTESVMPLVREFPQFRVPFVDALLRQDPQRISGLVAEMPSYQWRFVQSFLSSHPDKVHLRQRRTRRFDWGDHSLEPGSNTTLFAGEVQVSFPWGMENVQPLVDDIFPRLGPLYLALAPRNRHLQDLWGRLLSSFQNREANAMQHYHREILWAVNQLRGRFWRLLTKRSIKAAVDLMQMFGSGVSGHTGPRLYMDFLDQSLEALAAFTARGSLSSWVESPFDMNTDGHVDLAREDPRWDAVVNGEASAEERKRRDLVCLSSMNALVEQLATREARSRE